MILMIVSMACEVGSLMLQVILSVAYTACVVRFCPQFSVTVCSGAFTGLTCTVTFIGCGRGVWALFLQAVASCIPASMPS